MGIIPTENYSRYGVIGTFRYYEDVRRAISGHLSCETPASTNPKGP